MQLIEPPPASAEALAAAARGPALEVPKTLLFVMDQARSWTNSILKAAYQPGPNVVFLPFRRENGYCDTIRAAWRAGEYQLEMAQSRYLISIKVAGIQEATGTAETGIAEAVARKIFQQGETIRLTRNGEFDGGSWGEQNSREPGEWPNWLEEIRWWHRARELGFLTLRGSGRPTKAIISPEENQNRYWF
jgi:hypothetical protein